jgi:hypothetical protein
MNVLRHRLPSLLLAWLAVFWVAFTATPMPHDCEMRSPGGAQQAEAHHHGEHEAPAPDASCECVGHACCVAIAVPVEASAWLPSEAPARRAVGAPARGPALASTRPVLPFPIGPPTLPIA